MYPYTITASLKDTQNIEMKSPWGRGSLTGGRIHSDGTRFFNVGCDFGHTPPYGSYLSELQSIFTQYNFTKKLSIFLGAGRIQS